MDARRLVVHTLIMARTALALARLALSLSAAMRDMLTLSVISGNSRTVSALGKRGLVGSCFVASESMGYGPEGGWLGLSESCFTHSPLGLQVRRVLGV